MKKIICLMILLVMLICTGCNDIIKEEVIDDKVKIFYTSHIPAQEKIVYDVTKNGLVTRFVPDKYNVVIEYKNQMFTFDDEETYNIVSNYKDGTIIDAKIEIKEFKNGTILYNIVAFEGGENNE